MRGILRTGLAAAAVMLTFYATPAAARNFYVGAHGGLNYTHDGDTGAGDTVTYEFFGYGFGAELGVRIGNNFRLEGELSYRSNNVDTVGATDEKAQWNTTSLMANVFFDLELAPGFTPYLGGGLGIAKSTFEIGADTHGDTAIAWQLGAGIMFDLSSGLVISADYRLFSTQDMKLGAGAGIGSVENLNSSLFVGIKKFF